MDKGVVLAVTIFSILILLCMWGLYQIEEKRKAPPATVIIEECEYLKNRGYNGYFALTHKGNCSNPIHKEK